MKTNNNLTNSKIQMFSRFLTLHAKHAALVVALLLMGLGAKAQTYYVFYNSTYGYLYNNSGTLASSMSLQFDKSSVWNASGTLGTTDRTITSYTNSSLYLHTSTNNGGTVSLSTSSTNWQMRSNYLCVRSTGFSTTNYYLRTTNGTSFTTSNNTNGAYLPYTVTVSDIAAAVSDFSISGNATLSATGTFTYTHSNATTNAAYTLYTFNSANHYVNSSNVDAGTSLPETEVTTGYTWSLTGGGAYASVNASTGEITVSSLPANDTELTLTCSVTANGITKTATKTITLYGTTVAEPTITRLGNTVTLATSSVGATIYYTTDGSEPSSSSTAYSGPFSIDGLTFPVTVKAIAIRNGYSSTVASETYSSPVCETPVITISSTGDVTITCATEGASIYYTTDGTTPTSGSTAYSTTFAVPNETTVKAIAIKTGYDDSEVASKLYVTTGVSGSSVILNDLEDHSWSYYSDPDCPIRSLNPADVKITYYGDGIMMINSTGSTTDYTASSVEGTDYIRTGNADYVGGAKVNVGGEDENTFVYYKTLERGDATTTAWTFSSGSQSSAASRCPYTPIPNPFQVRPTYGSTWDGTNTDTWTGWRGFQCWRLKSVSGGAVYSVASDGSALSAGAIVNAETEIYFAPNSEYGMEVELEAVWAIAYVVKANADNNAIQTKTVGYERNFIVLHSTSSNYNFGGTSGKRITNINYSATVSTYYPDGTQGNNTGSTIRGAATSYNMTLQANTKFENIQFNMSSNTLNAAGNNLIIGRGVTASGTYCAASISGYNSDNTSISEEQNYSIRVESGSFQYMSLLVYGESTVVFSNKITVKGTLGCDYDRAKGSDGLLSIGEVYGSRRMRCTATSNKDNTTFSFHVKSGTINDRFYLGSNLHSANTNYLGKRVLFFEGGVVNSEMVGGLDGDAVTDPTTDVIKVKVTGGEFHSQIYTAATTNDGIGARRLVFTGGTSYGWIAGGANGTSSGDGILQGNANIYFGGNAKCLYDTENDQTFNSAKGGNIFGAGCGISSSTTAGRVDNSTVVVADNAEVARDVYGGGNYGFVQTGGTTNLYVLGGTVHGSVFGGSNQQQGQTVNITMKGGTVEGGLYGGSNATGTINNNVTMQINGGQVGTSSTNADIHGGGYGSATIVSGNVDLTLGTTTATSGVTVYGDVYGGSALGSVNGTSATTTYHTTVTLNAGTVNGSLYGGALGDNSTAANVYGPVTVNVMGGSVNNVFGCNNVNGAPQQSVTVNVEKTNNSCAWSVGNVYGGGNQAAYTGSPSVNIKNGTVSLNVYGGGLGTSATVTGNPVVTLGHSTSGYHAVVSGEVFGGGDAAPVVGSPEVHLTNRSTVGSHVFGGGNRATVTGDTFVWLRDRAKVYGNVYGGGNEGEVDGDTKVIVNSNNVE